MSWPVLQVDRLVKGLAERYSVDANDVRVVFAPYRICPLGAHIDHQLGTVTAMALDRGVLLAYVPSGSPLVRMQSEAYPGEVRFALDSIESKREDDWGNFIRGAAFALRQRHPLRMGILGLTSAGSNGGGLSSSAAIGVAYLLALEDANGLSVTPQENILLDQTIENEYLGLRNGVLDQSAILLSEADHLTVIDCRTLEHRLIAKPTSMPAFQILVVFSGVEQALVGTDYNRRVEECSAAARILLEASGQMTEAPLLGNVSREVYEGHQAALSGPPALRAKHFYSESDRVARGIEAWRAGDLRVFGKLMTESGESSIRNYECGSPPLVDLHETLVSTKGIYGARFSGGGFRGCCVALTDPRFTKPDANQVLKRYLKHQPQYSDGAFALLCTSGDHARLLACSSF